jgi:tetratricopeptide (TPR) repeat protein
MYASSQQLLGNYAAADALLGHARETLRYEASERKRRQIEAEVRRVGAEVAYNLGDLERCLGEVEQALAANQDNPELLLLQARALVATGETVRAREVLGGIQPQSPSYAAALAIIGLIQMQDGELERAARTFDRAHEAGMRGAIFENDRGRLMLELGRLDEAARHFESATQQAPTFMEARNNLAVAHRRAGQIEAAEQTLLAALERNPGYAPGHFNLAEVYRERSFAARPPQREALAREAMKHYDVALQLGYRSETVLERSSGVALAIGDLAAAEAMLLKLTESPTASGRVVFLLARVKKQQGELSIAQKLYEMAAERGFQEAGVYSDLGEVLLRQSNPQDARAALERALEINPDLVATRINLSVALLQLGELAGADQVLRRAEELAPDDPFVKEQREALRRLGHP